MLLSALNGILGYNVLISLFCMILSLPLMLFGAKVHLPEHVKSWPRSVVQRVKEGIIDKKRAIADKIHDAKDVLAGRFTGDDDDDEEDFVDDVPMSSDGFWGGPSDPAAPRELLRDEILAFDAMPPKYKLLALDAQPPGRLPPCGKR